MSSKFLPWQTKVCLLTAIIFLFSSCKTDYEEPEISLEDYQIAEGFELEVIASEPFLEAPVAIDFDNQGRIWTVEMRGYMQTLTGESEEMPNGVISILEDKDGFFWFNNSRFRYKILPTFTDEINYKKG